MDELEKKVREYVVLIDKILQDIEDTKKKRNKIRLEIEEVKAEIQKKLIEKNTARLNV